MTDKRTFEQLSPPSPEIVCSKKKNYNNTTTNMSMKEFQDFISLKIDALSNKIDEKVENLATKQDLKIFSEDIESLKLNNEEIMITLKNLGEDRDSFKKKFEQIDREMRRKNVIIRGVNFNRNNLYEELRNFFTNKMGINDQMEINELKVLKGRGQSAETVLIQFAKTESVVKIFQNIRKLTGNNLSIERDYSAEIRKKMSKLLKIKKFFKKNLADKKDKEKIIKVFGDRMVIEKSNFFWENGQLWCENELGYIKLNSIFAYQCNENSFDFVDEEDMQQ